MQLWHFYQLKGRGKSNTQQEEGEDNITFAGEGGYTNTDLYHLTNKDKYIH